MSQIPPAHLRGAVDLSSLVNRAATAGTAATGATPDSPPQSLPLPSLFFQGTDANFNDFLDLSMTVPVIVDLAASWAEPSQQLSSVLERVIRDYDGRFVLVTVDVETNPQLAQAFQAQSVPAAAAVIAGRPVQLFAGVMPEAQIRDVFEQLLQLAAQNGVTGRVTVEGDGSPAPETDAQAEPQPEPLPPHHAEAYEAIERGDFEEAIAEYKLAIAQDPRDTMAVAGLAQVSLLARLQGKTADEIRSAAAADPDNAAAQELVADLDISGGHVDDAFDRLLTLFPRLAPEERDSVRARLLDYFEIVGVDDPRVMRARARLASLLY
ncbi:tetratricopeptide repeat protein [Diaminobutyricibacter tongyongensis]|uniref:Tetratricopeptide repeat protein n=1 Tax=Leifsonia tongyongensis TaxID=1268043 RepID=A0A6L9XYZ9_9MICO|nr:tetratricopeptide repeat protein [Diaminobutyricibacter tongyongensis]NEN06662.1 tetratricopeptide repeat protein [Diaminobutyricibacter tongyongensis]